jgi:hypothetical protein
VNVCLRECVCAAAVSGALQLGSGLTLELKADAPECSQPAPPPPSPAAPAASLGHTVDAAPRR